MANELGNNTNTLLGPSLSFQNHLEFRDDVEDDYSALIISFNIQRFEEECLNWNVRDMEFNDVLNLNPDFNENV